MAMHKECQENACENRAKNTRELNNHVRKEHPIVFPCDKCDVIFEKKQSLYVHYRTHKPQTSNEKFSQNCYPCDQEECEFTAKDVRTLVKHILEKHTNPAITVKCDQCDYKAKDIGALSVHKVTIHGPQEELEPKEATKMFFHLIHDALIETNELIQKISNDTQDKFNRIIETQEFLKDNMKNIQTEVTAIKVEANKVKGDSEKLLHETQSNLAKLVGNIKEGSKPKGAAENASNASNAKEVIKDDQNIKKKQKVAWVGTSLSKHLKKAKFEEDLDVDLKLERAYCIEDEADAFFRDKNFRVVVPKVIENDDIDTLVLQTGSIEITNIDVNAAVNDPRKHIEDAKKAWFDKVEKDSYNLFEVAEQALKKSKSLKKVIIVKRLPRYDSNTDDILGIKPQLSNFANICYDQLWVKKGRPNNIQIVELDGLDSTDYLRNIVYGENTGNYDGLHLRGPHAARHFTYRAVQAVKSIIGGFVKQPRKTNVKSNHRNCPQAKYQSANKPTNQRSDKPGHSQSQGVNSGHQSAAGAQGGRYSDVVTGKNKYSVPVGNRFDVLGN